MFACFAITHLRKSSIFDCRFLNSVLPKPLEERNDVGRVVRRRQIPQIVESQRPFEAGPSEAKHLI